MLFLSTTGKSAMNFEGYGISTISKSDLTGWRRSEKQSKKCNSARQGRSHLQSGHPGHALGHSLMQPRSAQLAQSNITDSAGRALGRRMSD